MDDGGSAGRIFEVSIPRRSSLRASKKLTPRSRESASIMARSMNEPPKDAVSALRPARAPSSRMRECAACQISQAAWGFSAACKYTSRALRNAAIWSSTFCRKLFDGSLSNQRGGRQSAARPEAVLPSFDSMLTRTWRSGARVRTALP
jgi:hypothetical protein